MKIAKYYKTDKMEPGVLSNLIRELQDDLCELDYLKQNFTDKEAVLEKQKENLKVLWEEARKSKTYDKSKVIRFIMAYNSYNKISLTDPQEAMLRAEYLEKRIEYKYGGFLDKKFWNFNALLYLGSYLRSGKVKTLAKAIELLRKEQPNFIDE